MVAVKHLVQYKYGDVIDVDASEKKIGKSRDDLWNNYQMMALAGLHGLKYNTLLYNDIVMINERNIVIESKIISYSPMCLTQVPTIWHLKSMFHQCSL